MPISHNALSGCFGSVASFASHAFESLVALTRDPIATDSWLASGLFSLQ
ncbi:hypothetical protein A2U01_0076601, partial [Trifolium medium]|nr:hypothetical protein [Trifolium medium]